MCVTKSARQVSAIVLQLKISLLLNNFDDVPYKVSSFPSEITTFIQRSDYFWKHLLKSAFRKAKRYLVASRLMSSTSSILPTFNVVFNLQNNQISHEAMSGMHGSYWGCMMPCLTKNCWISCDVGRYIVMIEHPVPISL